ncbi:SRPBCC family protein [Microbacterium sp. SORGH_AS_0888]|uniref:SRPBCC family protein n=1 Tax=Microbacterium sp. SORGH_AS_0888 TaxID=3041791 RepID=UPI00278A3B00|nr:SRPBCC family protein [Microbacterium sp. SORGH_AS_0888]MDQ1131045.1 hypothetical protein [Microbacterium sp. SORGH_AS_0888]
MKVLRYVAEVTVAAPVGRVMRAVTDIASIHEWNPALSALHATDPVAVTGKPYGTRIRGLVPASVTYQTVTDTVATYEMSALGNFERGIWQVTEVAHGVSAVSHRFEHQGPILRLMHDAFTPVAMWRLERLRALLVHQAKTLEVIPPASHSFE